MGDKGNEDRFAPFGVSERSGALVLTRKREASAWLMRGCMHLLMGLYLAMFVAIGIGLATKPISVKVVLFVVFAIPALGGVAWFTNLYLRLDGVRMIRISDAGLGLLTDVGFFRSTTETVPKPDLIAVTWTARSMQARPNLPRSWWLEVQVEHADGAVELGWLAMSGADDPVPRAAAAELAERLGLPLRSAQHGAGAVG